MHNQDSRARALRKPSSTNSATNCFLDRLLGLGHDSMYRKLIWTTQQNQPRSIFIDFTYGLKRMCIFYMVSHFVCISMSSV